MLSEFMPRFYERLIRQAEYPGNTCPAEHVLVAYQSGSLPSAQAELLAAHLSACASCRSDLDGLTQAGQWFSANQAWVLSGLVDKAAAAGVLPWTQCPSRAVLRRYLDGAIPDSSGGRILAARTLAHLDRCPDCQAAAREHQNPLAVSLRLGVKVGQEFVGHLKDLLSDLRTITQARGVPAYVCAAPGYRAAKPLSITAAVVGGDGKVLVDEQGRADRCVFEILQSSVKSDGFLTIDLSTADRRFRSEGGQTFWAALSIGGQRLRLVLPETPISADGRVTFSGKLLPGVAVSPLPVSAMDLTVRQEPPVEV